MTSKIEENTSKIEENTSKIELPPMPLPIFPWSDFDNENIKFHGDTTDYPERMKHKIYNLWYLYGELSNNQKLIDYINKKEGSKNEKHFLKNTIVNIVDRIAKILKSTDLLEEIKYNFNIECQKSNQEEASSEKLKTQ